MLKSSSKEKVSALRDKISAPSFSFKTSFENFVERLFSKVFLLIEKQVFTNSEKHFCANFQFQCGEARCQHLERDKNFVAQ